MIIFHMPNCRTEGIQISSHFHIKSRQSSNNDTSFKGQTSPDARKHRRQIPIKAPSGAETQHTDQ